MNHSIKQKYFNQFLKKWETEFNEIPNILKYISSYSILDSKFASYSIIDTYEHIKISQLEWVSLVAQFENSLEKDFFKPYWIPLESDGYDLFIDISSGTFTLFEAYYFPMQPFQWFKKIWFKDMSQFLASVSDSTIDIEKQIKENERNWNKKIDGFYVERDKLGYAGKIDFGEIKKEDIYIFNDENEISCQLSGNTLIISNVSAMIVGLLPNELKIKLNQFESQIDSELNLKVKNLKSFIYHLHKYGFKAVSGFQFSFIGVNNGNVKFEDDVFTVYSQDKILMKNLLEKYKAFDCE